MNLKEKCTILICSCDNYSDLWDPFFKLFDFYWSDCPVDIVLNTESKAYHYNNLDIHCFSFYNEGKNIDYGKRMKEHLRKIKTPYVLILMDDFFFRKNVKTDEIEKVVNWLDNDSKAVVFNLFPLKDEYNQPSKKYPGYDLRPVYGNYKFNFQPSVWRTDYLLKSWKNTDTPWSWELYGNMRSFSPKYNFYVISNETDCPFDYGYRYEGMGVYHGKWVVDTVDDLFKKHGINIDYSVRGVYCSTDYDVKRLNDKNVSTEKRFASSIGLMRYLGYLFWCLKRKIGLVDKSLLYENSLKSRNTKYKNREKG